MAGWRIRPSPSSRRPSSPATARLVGVIAHELAHSWSGNLVTNATWSRFLAQRGLHLLFREPDHGGGLRPAARRPGSGPVLGRHAGGAARARRRRARRTAPPQRPTIPTAPAAGIVYDKGAIFLRTIERIVGRPRWDAYLRSYFDRHAFQPMTSARFLADLRANLVRGDAALEAQARSSTAGSTSPACPTMRRGPIPPPSPRSTRRCARSTPAARPRAVPFAGWNWAERVRFLKGLPRADADGAARRARPRLPLSAKRQCGGAVRLAPARARQPLPAGGAGRRAIPRARWAATRFVAAAVRDAGAARAIGAGRSPSASTPAPGPPITASPGSGSTGCFARAES